MTLDKSWRNLRCVGVCGGIAYGYCPCPCWLPLPMPTAPARSSRCGLPLTRPIEPRWAKWTAHSDFTRPKHWRCVEKDGRVSYDYLLCQCVNCLMKPKEYQENLIVSWDQETRRKQKARVRKVNINETKRISWESHCLMRKRNYHENLNVSWDHETRRQ